MEVLLNNNATIDMSLVKIDTTIDALNIPQARESRHRWYIVICFLLSRQP